MSNQQWQRSQQGPPGPPQGPAGWQGNPQQGWQGPPPQQPYDAPPRKPNRLPLIIAAVLVAVALIGVGAWFLTRPGDPPPTADPSTPSTSQAADPTPTPTVEKRDLDLGDLPAEVGGWFVKPGGATGGYYITDDRLDANGGNAQIHVSSSPNDISLETAIADLVDPVESSGGRVVCVAKDDIDNTSCYVETAEFPLIVATADPRDDISLNEVQAIADAIAKKHP